MTWQSVEPKDIPENNVATFEYVIKTGASRSASYLIKPTISVSAWQSKLTVLDESGTPLVKNTIDMPENGEKTFYLKLDSIPLQATGTQFNLVVSVSSGALSDTKTDSFTVGSSTEIPDETIDMKYLTAYVFPGNTQTGVGGNPVVIASNKFARIRFSTEFQLEGKYPLEKEFVAPAAGWVVEPYSTTMNPQEIQATDLTPRAVRTLEWKVSPGEDTKSGKIRFVVRRDGAPNRRFIELAVTLS